MATDISQTATRTNGDVRSADFDRDYDEEYTTETRRSFGTTEFWVFVILSALILFFGHESGTDSFSRDDAWRYVTWLGIGYLVSRGLAKAGSYESYIRRRDR